MLNAAGKYQDSLARKNVLTYIFQPYKTPNHIIGGTHVDLHNPERSMTEVADFYGKDTRVRIRHFVLAFSPKEIYAFSLLRYVAERICSYIGKEYQIVYAVHEDTNAPHIHFVFNAVSYLDGHRYRGNKESHYRLICAVKSALHYYGISTLIQVSYHPQENNPHE